MSALLNGIDDLRDDSCEDSVKESCIFNQVFFGCNSGTTTTKRCLVTGAIVFEPELSAVADTPLSSDSLRSTQASAKDYEVRDELDCSHGTLPDCENETAKRFKLSTDRSVQPKVINHGLSSPGTTTFRKTITCRLVESISGGVTYSSYLLMKPIEAARERESQEDVLTCQLSSLKNSSDKEVVVSKSIASPISEESFADKILVAGPSNAGVDKFAVSNPNEREEELSLHDLHHSNGSGSISNFMKDPRRLIQDEINHLLEATGWHYELRNRRNNSQRFSVYLSPTGKSFREFRKVWQLLGQALLGKKFKFWQQTSGKRWTDIDQFSSDLSEALMHINKSVDQSDSKKALSDIWILLHPFVVVAFIDKKIGVLRKRNVVGAAKSLLIRNNMNYKDPLSIKNPGTNRLKPASPGPHLTLETESVVVDGDEETDTDNRDSHACNAPSVSNKGNEVNLRGRDVNLSNKYQLDCSNDAPLQADVSKHNNSKVGNSGGLDDIALMKEKHEDMSPSMIARHLLQDDEKTLRSTESVMCNENSGDCISVKKASHKNSRRISEVKVSSLYRKGMLSPTSFVACDIRKQPEFRGREGMMGDMRSTIDDSFIDDENLDFQDCIQVSTSRKLKQQSSDKEMCKNVGRPKCQRKLKSQMSRHESRTQNATTSTHLINGTYTPRGPRTVLSWLLDLGAVSLNDVIKCRDARYHITVKDGLVTRDGILCRCCNVVFPVSLFKNHSGVIQNHPFTNLFLGNGKSYTACLLQAWSTEYTTRKATMKRSNVEDLDNNDDTCGICGDGGDLICCDGCPSTFHQMCLATQDLPEGNWYCSRCTCRICGDLVSNASSTLRGLGCMQCETKYHEACLAEMGLEEVVDSATWFCGRNCKEVYSGLQSQIGVPRDVSNGFSWTLLRCIHVSQRIESPKQLALKAECNSKLAVGLSIMEESFSAMSDPRTGISMIPHMVYNCGSNFARMDFHGFYTVVLEKGDILTSVASIRIHGVTIAEMPMVATCSRYRRQGMCRRLMDAIEEMLISLKIEKLVISALPDLVETWTVGFGFQPLEDYEKESLSSLNIMVLPGTTLLKKPLYSGHNDEPKDSDEPWSIDDYSGGGDRITIFQQNKSFVDDREVEDDKPNDSNFPTAGEDIESQLQKQFSRITYN